MALNSSGILILSCFLILTNSFVFPISEATNVGFSLDFVHRDSPKSPFRSISLSSSSSSSSGSRFDRLRLAFDRSISRAAYFQNTLSTKPSTIQSRLTSISGEYVINISIGTPPFPIAAIADTGSDVAWTQCKPCTNCFKQDDPLFDPNKTSTYRQVSCRTSACAATGASSCDSRGRCNYQLSYGDGSISIGDLASETFTFGSTSGRPVSIPKVVFGCGRDNSGTFSNMGTSGIVGLGGGQLSIIKQLDKQIGGKFSYCLVPISSETNVSSKINFGSNAEIRDPSAVTTPLIKKNPDTFYFLNLESVSVGTKTLVFRKKMSAVDQFDSEGNIIIDSGTTLTFLPREFYRELETTLREAIKAKPIRVPQSSFGLCYNAQDIDISSIPKTVLHFTGADVKLPPTNTFVEVSKGVICLTIVPADDIAILGNISQMNFLIAYDLKNEKLSFLPTDCTKQ